MWAGQAWSDYSVSIRPAALRWDEEAFERLRGSVKHNGWPRGGFGFSFASPKEWVTLWPKLLEFITAAMESREVAGKVGT